ncbi:gag-pol polyprotein [Tanacetum coccineum]
MDIMQYRMSGIGLFISQFRIRENDNVVAAQAKGNANENNGNQIRCYNCKGIGHLARNFTVRPRRRDAAYLQTQLLTAQKEEAGIQIQAKEFNLMVAAWDIDEIEDVNANCVLIPNLQQASTLGIQIGKALIPHFFGKFKFVYHWANPVKDFEWSNVSGIKLSLFSKLKDTFTSLQALTNLYDLFSGFMDYF